MDSLPQIATRSETVVGSSGPRKRGPDHTEDPGFAAELDRQIKDERRSSRPAEAGPERQRPEPSADAELQPEAPSEQEATHRSDEMSSEASGEAVEPGARLAPGGDGRDPGHRVASDRLLAGPWSALAAPDGGWTTLSTGPVNPTALTAASGAGAAPTEASQVTPEQVQAAAPSLAKPATVATEEQVNLRKLTRYLVDQTAEGATKTSETNRQTPPPAAASGDSHPGPSLDPRADQPAPPPKGVEADGDADGKLPKAEGKVDQLDLSKPFDPAARFRAAQTADVAPPSDPSSARGQQLEAAAHRALAEARQKLLQGNRPGEGRFSMTLNVEEASIPMRLRFTPDGHGGQQVAFLVATAKDLRELRRLMPEIETVLTELPVEVTDVKADVDSFRDVPSRDAPRMEQAGASR